MNFLPIFYVDGNLTNTSKNVFVGTRFNSEQYYAKLSSNICFVKAIIHTGFAYKLLFEIIAWKTKPYEVYKVLTKYT